MGGPGTVGNMNYMKQLRPVVRKHKAQSSNPSTRKKRKSELPVLKSQ
jgi:hypothetical protein